MRLILTVTLMALLVSTSFSGDGDRCWVFLRERHLSDHELSVALAKERLEIPERTLHRRAKVRSEQDLVDEFDLPLQADLLDSIRNRGYEIVVQSRMLRAVSVRGSFESVNNLAALPFVKSVVPLPLREQNIYQEQIHAINQPNSLQSDNSIPATDWTIGEYGATYNQWLRMNLVEAHNRGYIGSNVIVGMLDAGFKRLSRSYDSVNYHRMFEHLQIIATHDFVNNDSLVTNNGDQGDGSHGTMTLSCIAGFQSGIYIGAAPNVSVILSKTENTVGPDYQAEEDYWAAGLEWEERLGADIVSSSVSYRAWYPYELRDGRHAITSNAARLAAARGVLVFNSTGNQGGSTVPWVSCPADADSIISVGSVNADSGYSWFSSRGPTFDGRIKPDLTTQGVGVVVADANDSVRVTTADGTSFSTPSIAGAAAVVLSSCLSLTPMQLSGILKGTADRASHPDTLYGWGIPNIIAAIDSARLLAISCPPGDCSTQNIPEQYIIRAFPNPFNPSLMLYFAPKNKNREVFVYDVNGRNVATIAVPAGVSKARFVASTFSNGTYFLKFPDGSATKVAYVK